MKFHLLKFLLTYVVALAGVKSTTSLPASCPDPTSEAAIEANCDFYQDCVESQVVCGAEGYALGYGGKYCGKFVENLAAFSDNSQSWILGTLTCLKSALVDIVELPGGTTCDSLADTAFGSHVFCYMDNGFCDLIFGQFDDPISLANFVADLLVVFELEDFAQYVALKQVYDVVTQCPFYGGTNTGVSIGIVEAVVECPEAFNASASVLSTYRNDPLTDKTTGSHVYLGYTSDYEDTCGSCGYTIVDDKYLYGYNYAWNSEAGTRGFWEDKNKGYQVVPSVSASVCIHQRSALL